MPKSQQKEAALGKVLRFGQKLEESSTFDATRLLKHAMEINRLEDTQLQAESKPLPFQLSGIEALKHHKRGFMLKANQEAATDQEASAGHVLSLIKRDS